MPGDQACENLADIELKSLISGISNDTQQLGFRVPKIQKFRILNVI